jgi:hypothetical protein
MDGTKRRMSRRFVAAAAAATMLLATAGIAVASDLDAAALDAGSPLTSVTLAAGQEKTFTVALSVTGRQDSAASFQIYRDWTRQADGTFVGSNPATFHVPERVAGSNPTPDWTDSLSAKVSVPAGQPNGGPTNLTIEAHIITTSSPAALDMRTPATIAVTVLNPVVSNYTFEGFCAPVNNDLLNTVKGGQAVPLKWRLLDPAGEPVTDLASVGTSVRTVACDGALETDPVEEVAAGSSGLQNLGDGYYQFNWKTQKTTGCRTMQLTLPVQYTFAAGEGIPALQFQLR